MAEEKQQNANEENVAGEEPQRTTVPTTELPLAWTQMGQCGPEPMPVRFPHDVSNMNFAEETDIMIVGTAGSKITNIGEDFHTKVSPDLTQLVLRSHLIKTMEGLTGMKKLTLLELYDNMIEDLDNLNDGENGAPGNTLITLDMSYNVIRDMQPVEFCPNLTKLYLANNKLKEMKGLKGLSKLKTLDLGANRLRVMDVEELSGLVSLEELWLGKNKIEKIQGLENLKKLRRLDLQANRLTAVENLTSQTETLEELYLSHNAVTVEGASLSTGLAQHFPMLNVLDLSRNRLENTTPFSHFPALEELWLSGNSVAKFDDVEPLRPLSDTGLETVYLEYNPIADDFEYRKKLAEIVPSLKQIDATMIGGLAIHGIRPGAVGTGRPVVSREEEMRRLQATVIEKAREQTYPK